MVIEYQCNECREWKAQFHYSVACYRAGVAVYRGVCKPCRRKAARKTVNPAGAGQTSPTAWLLPRDERKADDRALDGVMRAWRGPVERATLKAAA